MTSNVAGQCCPLPASVRVPPWLLGPLALSGISLFTREPVGLQGSGSKPSSHLYSLQGTVCSGQGQSQPTASGWFRNESVIIWANEEKKRFF